MTADQLYVARRCPAPDWFAYSTSLCEEDLNEIANSVAEAMDAMGVATPDELGETT